MADEDDLIPKAWLVETHQSCQGRGRLARRWHAMGAYQAVFAAKR
jgi:hypothetical protein